MSDKIVLKFLYKERDIGIVVEDIDKVMLIDLVIEYWEKAESNNVDYPKFAEFTYNYKMSHMQLNNDKDLMDMFNNLSGKKEIYVLVRQIAQPSPLVQSALSLRSIHNSSNAGLGAETAAHVPPVVQPRKKLTPKRSGVACADDKFGNISPPVIHLGAFNDEAITHSIEETYADIQASLNEPIEERVLRRSPRAKEQGTTVNPSPELVLQTPDIVLPVEKKGAFSNTTKKSLPSCLLNKIPKTTAIRKGLQHGSGEAQQPRKESGKRKRAATVSLSADVNIVDDLNLDNDESYNPTSSDGNDTDESVCEEEKQGSEDAYAFMVNDNFDPFEGPVWDNYEDDEDNYFAKLYKNGEMYVDEEFGKIVLKPWQLFTDKQHLRDVVRDYCIQCGFSVIVPRANNSKYTVICSSGNCRWRLHAGRLPDGMTWAIKSIQNPEHTCVGLKSRNPMVNVKWATRVLMEDIRANNDISAKTLNKYLLQRWAGDILQTRKREYPGPLMLSLFWKACGAYSPFTFRKAMEALQKTNPLALTWLAKLGPQSTWSKHAFDPNVKSDVNKTNFVESFNATLGIDREQWPESDAPVIQPPVLKRGIGRPPRNRRREEDEQRKCKRSKTVKCSICKEFGHNAATCKGGLAAKEKGSKRQSTKKKAHKSPQQAEMMEHGALTSATVQPKQRKKSHGANGSAATN
ncbi:Zinc finger CCHC domain-containing protein 12 [Bienertia sinuspersici]